MATGCACSPSGWSADASSGRKPASGTVSLTPAQLSMLLEGIDWRRPVRSYAAADGGVSNTTLRFSCCFFCSCCEHESLLAYSRAMTAARAHFPISNRLDPDGTESADPLAARTVAVARQRDRALEAADRQAAADAVRAQVGEAGSQIEQLELRLDELKPTQAEKVSCFANIGCQSRLSQTSRRNPRGGRCRSICRAK